MKAIYNDNVYYIVEADADLTLETAKGEQFDVEFGDENLIVDPTDNEVADAENLAEHYGIDNTTAERFRCMLRGEISVGDWEDWKATRKDHYE
jgi:hypothetical protein